MVILTKFCVTSTNMDTYIKFIQDMEILRSRARAVSNWILRWCSPWEMLQCDCEVSSSRGGDERW